MHRVPGPLREPFHRTAAAVVIFVLGDTGSYAGEGVVADVRAQQAPPTDLLLRWCRGEDLWSLGTYRWLP